MTPATTPDDDVYQTLLLSGIPGTRMAYPEGEAPPLPWFVYMRRKGGEVIADDRNWSKMYRFRAELYMREYDPELVERFEDAIGSIGPYKADETWVPTERCLMVSYDFTYHAE